MGMTRRELALGIGAGALGATILPVAAPAAATGPALPVAPSCGGVTDPFSVVNPELLPWIKGAYPHGYTAPDPNPTLVSLRPKPAPRPPLEGAREQMVPGYQGDPDVRVLLIGAATSSEKRPAILHIHGGGNIAGTADDAVESLRALRNDLDRPCFIVTVDYRLAPETRFPGSLHDNFAALRWLHDHADTLGVDRTCIVVMGESAGGGHAASLALFARDQGVPVKAQILTYPMLDDRTGSTRCVPAHIGALMWTPPQNRFGWAALLGVPAGSARVPEGAVPARAATLAGLPATFIAVGSIDLFVQEDMAYAQRLIEAGVPTELLVLPGAYHGFDQAVPTAKVSHDYRAALVGAINRAFGA
jgi:acetyl esterase/lipase